MVNTANLSQFKHVEAGKHVGEPTSPHAWKILYTFSDFCPAYERKNAKTKGIKITNSWFMKKILETMLLSRDSCMFYKGCCRDVFLEGVTIDGQNPAPPRMMIIRLFIRF